MAGLFDYLDWRGDLTFEEAEFNEVDSMILAWLSYVALDGIVPAECSETDWIFSGVGARLGQTTRIPPCRPLPRSLRT